MSDAEKETKREHPQTGNENMTKKQKQDTRIHLGDRTLAWNTIPDKQTVLDSFNTYIKIRDKSPYTDLCLPLVTDTQFQEMVNKSDLDIININTLVSWNVDNQPVRGKPIESVDQLKSLLSEDPMDWDVEILERLDAAISLSPPVFLRTPQEIMINLDGAHRCVLASLKKGIILVRTINLTKNIIPVLKPVLWLQNDLYHVFNHACIRHGKPSVMSEDEQEVTLISMDTFTEPNLVQRMMAVAASCLNGGIILGHKQLADILKTRSVVVKK